LDDIIDGSDLYLKLTVLLSDFQILEGDALDLVVECDYSIVELFLAPQLVLLVIFHLNFY
jgi:hypothetical protein